MKPDSRKYLWGPVLVLLITLAATAAVVWQLLRMADAEDAVRFEKYVAGTQRALQDQIDDYLTFLRDGVSLFAGDREPALPQFRAFVSLSAISSILPNILFTSDCRSGSGNPPFEPRKLITPEMF